MNFGLVNSALQKTGSSFQVPDAAAPAATPVAPTPNAMNHSIRGAEGEAAAYLQHTGKTVDDRSVVERINAQRDWAGDPNAAQAASNNGYTNNSGTFKDGGLVQKAQSMMSKAESIGPQVPENFKKIASLVGSYFTGGLSGVAKAAAGQVLSDSDSTVGNMAGTALSMYGGGK